MNKIKVGEYVRTEIDTIGKVKTIHNAGSGVRYYGEDLYKNYYTIDYNDGNTYGRFDDYGITKHSKDIIDLIEEKDIVEVLDNWSGNKQIIYIYDDSDISELKSDIKNGFVKLLSITTAEQFNQVKYEV